MKEASFYSKQENNLVSCYLCNHNCRIKDSGVGICQVRRNETGVLYSLNYGELVAANVDPIEKKPLYHFLPGSKTYSIACIGCNFQCDFCQNWEISQVKEAKKLGVRASRLDPIEVVESALISGCRSVAYTYTEPTIYFEFAYDCAKLAKEKELANIFVTNGYMGTEVLEEIGPYLDAANVDLKSFREDSYRKYCKASLKPVLDNIVLMKKLGIWVELTTLIVPGRNDSKEELKDIATFIASIDKDIPWHVSRFFPNYKLVELSLTEVSSLKEAYKIGKDAGLNHIYLGNV